MKIITDWIAGQEFMTVFFTDGEYSVRYEAIEAVESETCKDWIPKYPYDKSGEWPIVILHNRENRKIRIDFIKDCFDKELQEKMKDDFLTDLGFPRKFMTKTIR
jgi:hypothetical protein